MRNGTWMRRALGALLAVGLAGCETEDWAYSFVVVADPHIAGNADHDQRLLTAIDWINANREAEKIELVVLVGDIAWGPGQVARTRTMLDGLSVPYVPVIGDNEIHNADEAESVQAWLTHYDDLAETLDGWTMAPLPVWNPDFEQDSWFVNFAFDYRGTHFVALDWVSRIQDSILGEQADLHDFAGGTFPWFAAEVAAAPAVRDESIVMLSHHPMHQQGLGALDAAELGQVKAQTSPRAADVYANFAGHYHLNLSHEVQGSGYELFVTDATWDDDNVVRVVRVHQDGDVQTYDQSIVDVSAPASSARSAPWLGEGLSFADWLGS